MAGELEVFHFEDDKPSFEQFGHDNGFRYWLASDLMRMLDYTTMQPILNAVNKAMSACGQLNISIPENFSETTTATGGKDWKLSRFACYLTVMNGDPKKPKVAAAQAYFISMAEAFRQYVQEAEHVDRVVIRGDVSEREKALSGTAFARGVTNYAFFQNAGYRGMYNLDLNQIKRLKHVPNGRSVLDFMSKTELAANLFRITQTEEKIRNEDITGQKPLERTAESVGKEVRATMARISGVAPERLAPAQDIQEVRAGLRKAGKEFARIDKKKKK